MWTPEVVLTAVGLLVSLLSLAYVAWPGRGRITYRVHLDTRVDMPQGADLFGITVVRAGEAVTGASIVLVRIRNQGRSDVAESDYNVPITLSFAGRTVLSALAPEARPATLERFLVAERLLHIGDTLTVSPIPLNQGESFKILVLLQGEGSGTAAIAHIKGATFVADPARIAPSRRSLALAAISLVFAGAFAGFGVAALRQDSELCRSGRLDIAGSSAFAPLMQDIATSYTERCGDATITVTGNGSLTGVEDLISDVRADPELRATRLAMSDVEVDSADVVGQQVATLLFAFVINAGTGVESLTLEQLQGIYAGRYDTWRDVDPQRGSDEAIVLVSREAGSGTRQVVERKILGGFEPAVTSDDCRTPKPLGGLQASGDLPLRCERLQTSRVLDEVDDNLGALGYAQPSEIEDYANVRVVRIDNVPPTIEAVRNGQYALWSREILYTFGIPEQGTLLDAFLDYVSDDYLPTPESQDLLIDNGFEPLITGG